MQIRHPKCLTANAIKYFSTCLCVQFGRRFFNSLNTFVMNSAIMDANNSKVKQRKTRTKYTEVEDTLILQGVQAFGREWKSVLSFMRRHVEVLGEAGKQYIEEGINDKALQERLRKRATKLLNNALDSR